MKVEANKNYRVWKYNNNSDSDLGILTGEDVKKLLKGYKYEELLPGMGMWYSEGGRIAYDVKEV